jgi:sec-independent protein translocase protein TatC
MAARVPLVPQLPGDDEHAEVRMSFGEHIEDLRRRLIYALLGVAVGVGVATYYVYAIVAFLTHPLRMALAEASYPTSFVYSAMARPVIAYLNLAVIAGLVIASPWVIYQLWLFIAAGLYRRERTVVYKFIGPSILLFLLGVSFFFFLVLPITLRFFIGFADETAAHMPRPWPTESFIYRGATTEPGTAPGVKAGPLAVPALESDPPTAPPGQALIWFNQPENRLKMRIGEHVMTLLVSHEGSLFTPMPSLDEYLSFVTFLGLIFGISFETPMVLMVLAKLGIVSPQGFVKVRKFAWFGCAIVAAVATPTPDMLTMMTLFLPLVGLYELGIVLARFAAPPRPPEDGVPTAPA